MIKEGGGYQGRDEVLREGKKRLTRAITATEKAIMLARTDVARLEVFYNRLSPGAEQAGPMLEDITARKKSIETLEKDLERYKQERAALDTPTS